MYPPHYSRPALVAFFTHHLPQWLIAILFCGLGVADEHPGKPLALVGGKVATLTTAGVIEGSVLIKEGKIVGVGQIDIPEDAQTIDIRGMIVTPGLIDARSCLWLDGAAARDGAADAGLDAVDAVDPFSEDWQEVVRQGVTAVYVQPSSAGICGGRGCVLRVGPGKSSADLVVNAEGGVQASLGASTRTRSSRERFSEYEQLKKLIEGAKPYDESWKKYEAAKSTPMEPQKDGTAKNTANNAKAAAKPPARDPAKDLLRNVLNRKTPLRLEAHHEDCLARAVKLADELVIRLILEGVSHPKASLETIRSRRIPLVLGPVLELDEIPEFRKQRHANWLSQLIQEDVRWALATFGRNPRDSRLLRVQAAAAVAQGVPAEQVLRAVTQNAAAILGVDDKLGSVAVGMQADLAVFAGDPLDPSVPVQLVMSRGEIVYQATANTVARFDDRAEVVIDQPLRISYALRSSRCWTESGRLEPRTIVVSDGRIVAVHAQPVPTQVTKVIDVGAAVITPGLVNAHSDLGFSKSIDEPADADASYLRAADVFDPHGFAVRQATLGGFLNIAFAPGSTNVVAGSAALVRPGTADPIREEFLAGKFVLTASSRNTERYPSSLAGQIEVLNQFFNSESQESNLFIPGLILEQLRHERRRHVQALRSRERVAMFEVQSEAEVDAALQLIRKFKLRGVLIGPGEIQPFLPEIRELNVGIVARPVQGQDYDRYIRSLVEASDAGIPLAFGLGTPEQLRVTAALAINAGLKTEAAMLALTSTAARLLGMSPGSGEIEPGQTADLVLWTGPPWNPSSRAECVIADGKKLEPALPNSKKTSPAERRLAGAE